VEHFFERIIAMEVWIKIDLTNCLCFQQETAATILRELAGKLEGNHYFDAGFGMPILNGNSEIGFLAVYDKQYRLELMNQ
jgi:hypothetical protein